MRNTFRNSIIITGILVICTRIYAQDLSSITISDVSRIEKILADDDMQGRKIFTTGIKKAAGFIAKEFAEAGLKPLPGCTDYYQSFSMTGTGSAKTLDNIVGMIPGKIKPDQCVIFSAHYDHLGTGKPDAHGDSIYNGANDDASGTTAVITLAKYFGRLNNNQRTVIFVAFTAEESGHWGSSYLSERINPDEIMAMFNIEMIGTESKWGKNSAYVTGYDKSDIGSILQKNIKNSLFIFYPDPYPGEELFLRSDNTPFAQKGVPAHTISTAKMGSDPYYHKPGDEIETLDLNNMTGIIRAIALGASSIIAGEDEPVRLKRNNYLSLKASIVP
jgi:Zn-dependent M28 family amino/carboxypeptidase